jgi:hypothetical protein
MRSLRLATLPCRRAAATGRSYTTTSARSEERLAARRAQDHCPDVDLFLGIAPVKVLLDDIDPPELLALPQNTLSPSAGEQAADGPAQDVLVMELCWSFSADPFRMPRIRVGRPQIRPRDRHRLLC